MDGFQSKLPPGILPHGLPQVKEVQPAVTQVEQEKEKEKPKEGNFLPSHYLHRLLIAIIIHINFNRHSTRAERGGETNDHTLGRFPTIPRSYQ